MLLLPHSSHLFQPLDVGVFSPLKTALSSQHDKFLRAGISRLEKVEWLECLVKAHPQALTKKNIMAGWRGACIYPLNCTKALSKVPNKAPSESTSGSLTIEETDDAILSQSMSTMSISSPVLQNIHSRVKHCAITNTISTPVRRLIPRLIDEHAQSRAENKILQCQLKECRDVLGHRRERKIGKRVIIKDINLVSKREIAIRLHEAKKATAKKRTKEGGKRNSKTKQMESCDKEEYNEEE